MSFRKTIRRVFEQVTGLKVYRKLPRGLELSRDLSSAMPDYSMRVVFDVGANKGQSAIAFRRDFPDATIYCFEPVAETFQKLSSRVHGLHGVHLFNLALGARASRGTMIKAGTPDMFYLKEGEKAGQPAQASGSEEVEVIPLDQFCDDHKVDHISFLKVDTEGADLEVLKGAQRMLSAQQIDFVEVEAGMNPRNSFHVPFEALKDHLEARGYLLFAIYEQVHEWPTRHPNLRRSNPLFISSRLVDSHSSTPAP